MTDADDLAAAMAAPITATVELGLVEALVRIADEYVAELRPQGAELEPEQLAALADAREVLAPSPYWYTPAATTPVARYALARLTDLARSVAVDDPDALEDADRDALRHATALLERDDRTEPMFDVDANRIIPGDTFGAPFVLVQVTQLDRLARFCAAADCDGLSVADVEPTARLILKALAP